ncbi:hypothetical protein [Subtercola sp. RTI3]|uniref:hypothetical protein n=1 Tax=Subtercola sp. RTI3 TaxID=3048639 RepID=UPI002B237CAE|nr:hypothetical protein [Subtercola sp. RTI3]MEA9986251.1 hypothetical protein [Subtercola sp. RTI3]
MSRTSAVQNGYDVGKAWDVYFDDGTDVQVNDRLSFNGENYIVKGRQVFSSFPAVSHIQVTAVTENAHA